MQETSLSLLVRLRHADSRAWDRWVDLYAPLVNHWMQRYDVPPADRDDLLQEVLLAVSKGVGEFDHSGHCGAFRAWLKKILVHRLRNYWRSRDRRPLATGSSDIQRRLDQLEDPHSELTQLWNQQHDQHVASGLLAAAQHQFASNTWNAFRRVALEGESAETVARDLGMSLNAVFVAKSRVLSRLRERAAGLVDTA